MMHEQTMQGGGGNNDRTPGVGNRNTDAQDAGERGFFNDWDGGGAGGAHAPDSSRQLGNRQGQHAGRGPKNYRRSDARISDDVHEALTNDDELDASEIEVAVSDGEVTLSGTVHTRAAKRRAEELLDNLAGVSHVQNQIKVVSASNTVGG